MIIFVDGKVVAGMYKRDNPYGGKTSYWVTRPDADKPVAIMVAPRYPDLGGLVGNVVECEAFLDTPGEKEVEPALVGVPRIKIWIHKISDQAPDMSLSSFVEGTKLLDLPEGKPERFTRTKRPKRGEA
jgi:hypothetical protein